MNERPSLQLIALSYLKISLSSFGGGLSAWTQLVVVEELHWLDDREFLSALALCRILPGPNMVNFAVYLGSRLRGIPGVIAAIGGLLIVPFLLVVTLGILYFEYRQTPHLQPILTGVASAAAGMTIGLGIKMLLRQPFSFSAIFIAAGAFLLIGIFRVPLLFAMAMLVPVSVLLIARGKTNERR
jgi:chromate transporter